MKKTLFATAALVMVIASPALAQSYDPTVGSGNIVPNPAAAQRQSAPRGVYQNAPSSAYADPYSAYAQVPVRATRRRAPAAVSGEHRAPAAVSDEHGNYIGSDPDPNVRLQLQKDHDAIQ